MGLNLKDNDKDNNAVQEYLKSRQGGFGSKSIKAKGELLWYNF